MLFSPDMKDLIEIFEKHSVKYVIVGGHAVNYYGYVRSTQDLDVLIYPSIENAQKVISALREFGFGDAGIPQSYFERSGSAIHLGVEPNRIDLLTHLKDVDNDQIFTNMTRAEHQGIVTNVIALQDLIDVKRRSDRPRDHVDAEELEKTQNGKH